MADEDERPEDQQEEPAENEDLDAEGEDGEDDEDEESGGLDLKKIILFVVVPLVLLCGIGAGLYFSGLLDGLLGKGGEHTEESVDDHGGGKKSDGHGGGHGGGSASFLEIPTMIVNLNSEDGTPRYLRLSVQLELNNYEDLSAVEAVIPRVVDQFQTYLRELRVKDLRGSAGIYRLQMELLWRVNQAAAPVEVKDVLFQEILIQ